MDNAIIVGFLLCFVATIAFMLVAIVRGVAEMGGWNRLAEQYRATERPSGERLLFRSGSFGMVGYSGVLQFVLDSDGLYMATMFPFHRSHPPLFIPWSDITISPTKFIWWEGVRLHFAQCPGVFFSTSGPLADQLTEAKREHTSRAAVPDSPGPDNREAIRISDG